MPSSMESDSYRIFIFQCTQNYTWIACCRNNIAMRIPKCSPSTLVNLLIIEHAPRMASKTNKSAVHTHTLHIMSRVFVVI